MGAQAAALLAAGGPVGDPRPPFPVVARTPLDGPEGYDLGSVVRRTGAVGLAPHSWDGAAYLTVLPGGATVRVTADLVVESSAALTDDDVAVLRRALDLDRDLTALHAAAPPWVAAEGAGRQLRAATPFEAVVQALASTNTSYAGTQAMLRELCGSGPVPDPGAVEALALDRWGYRARSLRVIAREVDDDWGGWDPLTDDETADRLLALPGIGRFAAAGALVLLGRPRPLVLDGWLAAQVPDVTAYEALGRWGGEVLWLEVSRRWCARPAGPAAPPRAPGGPDAARA